MPIAKINEDGTVKIYGQKSGKVIDVKPEQLGEYNPKLIGEYYEKLEEKPKFDEESTQKALDGLTETISTNEGVDPTEVTWEYIHQMEPTFKSKGVDAGKLWDVYSQYEKRTKAQQSSKKEEQGGGIFDFIGNLFSRGQEPQQPQQNNLASMFNPQRRV